MKILFIYPNVMGAEYIQLGIGYLSSYVKQKGHKTSLADYTWGGDAYLALNKIKEVQPDIIGFSVRSAELEFSLKLAKIIKKRYNIPILFGGVHPTIDPEGTISKKQVDMVIVGEGEEALLELLENLEKKKDIRKIKNLWLKDGDKIIRNEVRPLENLDSYPYPDRELFNLEKYFKTRGKCLDIIATRGCPFYCTYCINHIFHKLYKHKSNIRVRDIEDIYNEIKIAKEKWGIKTVIFHDDMLLANKEFSLKLMKRIKELNIKFSCNARVETLDDDICKALKESGCETLCIGVEAGSEQIRREVLKRNMSNEQIINAFNCAKRAGLQTYSFNMVGIPFETKKDMKKTIKLNQIIRPTSLQVSIFQPYPGTELYELCKQNKWISEGALPISHKLKSIVKYPYITPREIENIKTKFRFKVLWPYNKKNALINLAQDITYPIFTKFRTKLPTPIKNALFTIVRKINSGKN